MSGPLDFARVRMWGLDVGAVLWDPDRGAATFEYDPAFLETGLQPAPLRMPVEGPRSVGRRFTFPELPFRTFLGLPGMLADALPDRFGNRVIEAWLARQGRSMEDFNPIERLCYVGTRAMGALEFQPEIAPAVDRTTAVEIGDLVRLANQVLRARRELQGNIEEEPEAALLDILRVGTSAGGMRAKAVLAVDSTTGDIRSGQVDAPEGYEYWILKFDGVSQDALGDPEGYGRIELAYHFMARAAGIVMTECRLLEEGGRSHFMTRRFDRPDSGGRLHLQSLCALIHADYNSPGTYAYEQAFGVLRHLHLPYEDAEQLFRRMVFNVLARNLDDHTKNIAFLMDREGEWRLSPAFDVIYAHNPAGTWTSRHQMSVNGKVEEIGRSDLSVVGREMGVKGAGSLIDEVGAAVADWLTHAEQAGVPGEQAERIARSHVRL